MELIAERSFVLTLKQVQDKFVHSECDHGKGDGLEEVENPAPVHAIQSFFLVDGTASPPKLSVPVNKP